jgi:hypothetical protein
MPTKRSARKRKTATKSAARLAGQRIDELEDPSASRTEKTRRKKRLLEGPEEFRSFRNDKSARPARRSK